jgi:DNA-binding transcriptional LysR family regulator
VPCKKRSAPSFRPFAASSRIASSSSPRFPGFDPALFLGIRKISFHYPLHKGIFALRAINPDQLRAFADVIELGSFSAAAERLNLTQPAVSQQVKQLERRFALKLIERVARKVTPTPAGIELMAHARRLEAVMAGALDAMARHATGALGRVRIGTGATACIHLLPPVLRDLRGRLPSLEIAVSTGNTAHILKLLEDNALDVGLVTLPARGRALSITPVLDDEFVAIASPDAPPLPRRVTPAVLAARPLVLYESGAQTRRIVNGLGGEAHPSSPSWSSAASRPSRSLSARGSVITASCHAWRFRMKINAIG